MKTLLPTILLLVIGQAVSAQWITVLEKPVYVKGETVIAWVVPVGDDHAFAQNTFMRFVKKELKLKPKRHGKTRVVALRVRLPSVSAHRGDLEGILFSEYDTYKLGLAFALGYDIVINSREYPTEMDALREVAIDYLKYHYTRYYDGVLEKQEKEKARLEKQTKKTEREINSLLAANRRYERKIHKTEDAVVKQELRNKIASHEFTLENVNTRLLELNQEIEKKHHRMNKTRQEYNEVLAQIRALRSEKSPRVRHEDYNQERDIY
ncbi:MAG: hypothetical protein WA960_21935 [Tunicatimonas sp.]